MDQLLITFKSTMDVFDAEKKMKKLNIKYDFVPTPRAISKECGFSIIIPKISGFIKIKKFIHYSKTYIKIKENNNFIYKEKKFL